MYYLYCYHYSPIWFWFWFSSLFFCTFRITSNVLNTEFYIIYFKEKVKDVLLFYETHTENEICGQGIDCKTLGSKFQPDEKH
jgi:hypothetical protein